MRVSPFLRRNIFEPLWCIKNNSPLISHWKYLEREQYLSTDKLKESQFNRLKFILGYSYKHNEYYKLLFDKNCIEPSRIKTPDDMDRIPTLSKHDIRENYDIIISNGYNRKNLLLYKTGGSVGIPLEIYMTHNCSHLKNAFTRMCDRWTGWKYGEPIGALWGNIPKNKTLKEKIRNYLILPYIYLDTVQLNEESVKKFCKEWKKAQPTLLFGHAHSIYILAKYLVDEVDHPIKPKGIISSSMTLLDNEKAFIEEVFHVKVFNRYGCEEVSLIACECEKHKGLHINTEHLYVEFLNSDGTHAKHGVEGEIVVTDLLNKAMPLIRYKVGDVGIPIDHDCSCGRGAPLMSRVSGRTADFLIRVDGTKIAGISIIENTLTKIPGIEQMQIIQKSLFEIIVNIVPDEKYISDTEKAITKYFKITFGGNVHVAVNKVDKILKSDNGKYRFSICEILT